MGDKLDFIKDVGVFLITKNNEINEKILSIKGRLGGLYPIK